VVSLCWEARSQHDATSATKDARTNKSVLITGNTRSLGSVLQHAANAAKTIRTAAANVTSGPRVHGPVLCPKRVAELVIGICSSAGLPLPPEF
jgi:hypothetical protein